MRTFLTCGKLFDGLGEAAVENQTIIIDDGRIGFVGPILKKRTSLVADKARSQSESGWLLFVAVRKRSMRCCL